jgi:DNA-binding response OmpR family regulator
MEKRVLLIEDDRDFAHSFKQTLFNAGYNVECFSEGTPIVERKFEVPDIFIFDIDLPTIDGVALCKFLKIQTDLKRIPILLVSQSNYDLNKGLNAGADAFFTMPFSSREMLNCLDNLLVDRSRTNSDALTYVLTTNEQTKSAA